MVDHAREWLKKLEDSVTKDGTMPASSHFFFWFGNEVSKEEVRQLPYVNYSEDMYDFWEWLENSGYAQPFDYSKWLENFIETHNPEEDWSWIESADKDSLNKFLFCLRRRERFHSGLWASRLSNGFMLCLCQRMVALEEAKITNI